MVKRIEVYGLDPAIEPDEEKLHRVIKLGLGSVPVAGALAAELFTSLFESPLAKRRTEWMTKVTEVVNELIDEGVLTEDNLRENEVFVSTVAQTCTIALRNHQEEKLKALQNVVRNSAVPSRLSDDYRQLFLSFVDVCTVTHIRFICIFSGPEEWALENQVQFPMWSMGGLVNVVEHCLPDLVGGRDLYEPIWKDLYQRGYVDTDSLGGTMSREGMLAPRLTELGRRLFKFIS
ncbi:hypothetical protein [Pseudomonas oryzihabitans]|uniref:hypothetical protein n=1 Tax=Pseudomonas oryzihabitans TaxID=47885 RepID=UPI0030BF3A6E